MNATRIFDILEEIKQYPKPDFFAKRDKDGETWVQYSTEDYITYSHDIAYALLELGYPKGSKIVTIMNNRPAWNFLDMGIMLAGMVHVPVYPTLNQNEFKHILNHSDCVCIVIGIESIYRRVAPIIPEIEQNPKIFVIDKIENFPTFNTLLELGKNNRDKWRSCVEDNKKNISTEELATIIYTSGTTGQPKGVMLSHKNICHNFMPIVREYQLLDHNARILSFLPLCHVYERTVNYHYQFLGLSHYYAKNLSTIAKDMHDIKADGFCAVPRVFEMMYDKIYAAGKKLKGIKRFIYYWAMKIATRYDFYNHNIFYLMKINLADKLVYSKWRESLSGKPEMTVVSGGSSIEEKIIRLFTAAKVRVYEGYGLTETSPVIAVNNPKKKIIKVGTVGEILPGVEFKLAEDGEIMTKGHCLMMGYYKDEEYTKKVIDEDGWFHTGDIGTLEEGKYLKITDRKKEIFKLSLGKYITPQSLEGQLRASKYIDNVMVIGENEKFVSAIIVPDFTAFEQRLIKNKINIPATHEELIHLPEVIKKMEKEVNRVNRNLAEHEQIKRFRMVPDTWSTATGELSQTLKLKRRIIYERYDSICREIYNYDHKESL